MNMSAQKFRPEIARNRFTSNWVLASKGVDVNITLQSPARLGRFKLITVAVLAVVLSLLSYSIFSERVEQKITHRGQASNPTAKTRPTAADSDQPEICVDGPSGEDLDRLGPNSRPDGFDQVSRVNLGGTIFIELRCQDSSAHLNAFRVTWSATKQGWRVIKISRPAGGQSGDSQLKLETQ
jgi:hypothetical protein